MTITAVFNKLFNLDEGCLFYRFNNADGKIWIMPAKTFAQQWNYISQAAGRGNG